MNALYTLPDSHHAQPEYEFRAPSGTFSYEFSRVYGPPRYGDKRGAICRIDEDLSYWSTSHYTDVDHSSVRVVDYRRARAARRGHLTFGQFASELYMRRALPDLLKNAT